MIDRTKNVLLFAVAFGLISFLFGLMIQLAMQAMTVAASNGEVGRQWFILNLIAGAARFGVAGTIVGLAFGWLKPTRKTNSNSDDEPCSVSRIARLQEPTEDESRDELLRRDNLDRRRAFLPLAKAKQKGQQLCFEADEIVLEYGQKLKPAHLALVVAIVRRVRKATRDDSRQDLTDALVDLEDQLGQLRSRFQTDDRRSRPVVAQELCENVCIDAERFLRQFGSKLRDEEYVNLQGSVGQVRDAARNGSASAMRSAKEALEKELHGLMSRYET